MKGEQENDEGNTMIEGRKREAKIEEREEEDSKRRGGRRRNEESEND